MIKRETVVVLISTAVGIGIVTILSFFTVWIGFPANNPQDSFKDALGFSGGLFGGLATFGAAIVAAHLFNDWREVKQYEIILSYIMLIKSNIQDYLSYINSIRSDYLRDIVALKTPHTPIDSYREILTSMCQRERVITDKLTRIMLDVNELYYLKHKNFLDPASVELGSKIDHFQKLVPMEGDFIMSYQDRLTNKSYREQYDYLVNDLTTFIYDKILVNYLDELILDKSLK